MQSVETHEEAHQQAYVGGRAVEVDEAGFLVDPPDWDADELRALFRSSCVNCMCRGSGLPKPTG